MSIFDQKNLRPLKEGEHCDLWFENDDCLDIEKLVGHYPKTIFKEPLMIFKCGLILLKKQREELTVTNDESLIKDVAQVLAIARLYQPTGLVGSYSSRYAPVLFNTGGGPGKDPVEVDLCRVLGVKTLCEAHVPDFGSDFFNGVAELDKEGQLSGDIIELNEQGVEEYAKKAHVLFAYFQSVKDVSIGLKPNGFPVFPEVSETPHFRVGYAPSGRIGGLMANFAY